MWLTDEELAAGAATQDKEWGVGSVGRSTDKSTHANAPEVLAEVEGAADHLEGVADEHHARTS